MQLSAISKWIFRQFRVHLSFSMQNGLWRHSIWCFACNWQLQVNISSMQNGLWRHKMWCFALALRHHHRHRHRPLRHHHHRHDHQKDAQIWKVNVDPSGVQLTFRSGIGRMAVFFVAWLRRETCWTRIWQWGPKDVSIAGPVKMWSSEKTLKFEKLMLILKGSHLLLDLESAGWLFFFVAWLRRETCWTRI